MINFVTSDDLFGFSNNFNNLINNTGQFLLDNDNQISGILNSEINELTNTINLTSGIINDKINNFIDSNNNQLTLFPTYNLGNNSFCIYTGMSDIDWLLPSLNSGNFYFIKNAGAGKINLISNSGEYIFTSGLCSNLSISIGQAYIVASSDGFWAVM